MDYKEYYKEVKKRLEPFSEVIYFEPMTDEEVIDLENRLGQTINPMYREYLLAFGMVQDAFENLATDTESLLEDFEFIEEKYSNYLPIFSDEDFEDTISLINNKNPIDNYVYNVDIDSDDNIGKLKKTKTFQQIIEESIFEIKQNYKNRCLNKDKVNSAEYSLSGRCFADFIKVLETEGLKQIKDWQPKYSPNNMFGDEIAIFELFDQEIIIQRNLEDSIYIFDLEEALISEENISIIRKIESLLKLNRIKFEKIECKLIENA
ncbi:MAG: hypothetical protein N4A49_01445 [Marinifilaceae bacterium]|jgi:hypothetical protein|nr:hypothetical protein [Marinifilaceae bacterium]